MKITVVYDNEAKAPLKADWGFSAIIEKDGKRVLFDTGTSPEILKHNLDALGEDISDIKTVIISHIHGDHAGGISVVEDKRILSPDPLENAEVVKDSYDGGWYKTRVLGTSMNLKEQYLYVPTEKGLVVVVGCSHPGLENIIEDAKKLGKLYCIMGGFHGFSKLEALEGIPIIYPCHCTQKKEEILEKFGNAEKCYAGCKVII